MEQRSCDYCKFSVPFDATACGHCGRDIPYRKEKRFCKVHNREYEVQYNISYKTIQGSCPTCESVKKSKETRSNELTKQMKSEIEERVKLIWADFNHDNYEQIKNSSCAKLDGEMIFLSIIIYLPILALIFATIVYFAFNISFSITFILSYVFLAIRILVYPKIRLKNYQAEYNRRRDLVQNAHDEVRNKYKVKLNELDR